MRILDDEIRVIIAEAMESLPPGVSNEEFAEAAQSALNRTTREFASSLKADLLTKSKQMLVERRHEFAGFAKRNAERWRLGFDLLETLIVICTEIGEMFNEEYRRQAVEESDLVFDLMVRHHARACIIANEVLTLLQCGYPDGAHARWRALHEVAATTTFVREHGQECAERFYAHEIVDRYKGAIQFRENREKLRAEGLTDFEIAQLKAERDKALAKYGKEFRKTYGWAAPFLVGVHPTFSEIEKAVGLSHWRPYFSWASQNVHAGAAGVTPFLATSEAQEDFLLAGASNSGMTDPAHSTAISLVNITCCLLVYRESVDGIVYMNLIDELKNDIGEAFLLSETPP